MTRGGYRPNAGRSGSKIKVESCRRIDARQMQLKGLFAGAWQGTWWWRDALTGKISASIDVQTMSDSMLLSYCCNNTTFHEVIRLGAVPCGFGGRRVMFHCPRCHGRISILFLHQAHFRCRRCHNLAYQAQSESAFGRIMLAQTKCENALRVDQGRPKGMHRATYRALRDKLGVLKKKQWDLVDEYCLRST